MNQFLKDFWMPLVVLIGASAWYLGPLVFPNWKEILITGGLILGAVFLGLVGLFNTLVGNGDNDGFVDNVKTVVYNSPMVQEEPKFITPVKHEVNKMNKYKVNYQIVQGNSRKGASAIIEARDIATARALANEQFPHVTMVTEYR